jgi:hypothetical protein
MGATNDKTKRKTKDAALKGRRYERQGKRWRPEGRRYENQEG